MRISDWSSDVCSSDLGEFKAFLGSAHDFAHSDPVRRPGKAHSARATAHGFDEAVARKRVHDLHQMIVGYVIGARNLTDRTETTIVERKVDQNPERIIGVAREPQPHLPRETSSRSEEHKSELQSLMRISYAVICLKKKKK